MGKLLLMQSIKLTTISLIKKQNTFPQTFNYLNNRYHQHTYFSTSSLSLSEAEIPNIQKKIFISDNAAFQLKKINSNSPQKNNFLRITVDSGGCHGYQYLIKLDQNKFDDDIEFEKEGAKVLVDNISLDLIDGGTLDYVDELIGS
ncbi:hypothetical protein HK099_003283, partial [Clydaea vesicula]